LSSNLLSRFSAYAEEITGGHQCAFRCNRSIADHIFCILQIKKKKWEYKEAVHHLFIDFKKAYDSGVRSCIIFSLRFYPYETGKANKTVSDLNV
jgi:hypothetical protein